MENSTSLVTRVTDNIAIVRLDRPAQRNSLSVAVLRELGDTVSQLLAHDEIKALVLTGTGDVFASGADLGELSKLAVSDALQFAKLGQDIFQTISEARVVTVAAINGFCMGGGLDLALSCDIRLASRSAIFAHPGARRGIITGWGGTQRLPRLIGRSRALELFATARLVNSEEAFLLGLVSSVEDPVLECALEKSRQAVRQMA